MNLLNMLEMGRNIIFVIIYVYIYNKYRYKLLKNDMLSQTNLGQK